MNVVYPVPIIKIFFLLCCLCKLVVDKRVVQSYNWTIRLDKGELQHYYCDLNRSLICLCDGCKNVLGSLLLQSSSPCSLRIFPNTVTVLDRAAFGA